MRDNVEEKSKHFKRVAYLSGLLSGLMFMFLAMALSNLGFGRLTILIVVSIYLVLAACCKFSMSVRLAEWILKILKLTPILLPIDEVVPEHDFYSDTSALRLGSKKQFMSVNPTKTEERAEEESDSEESDDEDDDESDAITHVHCLGEIMPDGSVRGCDKIVPLFPNKSGVDVVKVRTDKPPKRHGYKFNRKYFLN